MKNVKDLLAHIPYRASFYDKDLKLIYSNNRSDGSFFSEPEENELPQWVWTSLEQSPEQALHFQIPTESFDRILFQTYQAVKDDSGELLGVITFIQDLKPVLASYLNESGQAIVGWSDVTSGPSSTNPIFDD